jgi:hypothetical protein
VQWRLFAEKFLMFVLKQKLAGKTSPATDKGNTLLNYAGVKLDLLPFVCDAAIAEQGKFMPGSTSRSFRRSC